MRRCCLGGEGFGLGGVVLCGGGESFGEPLLARDGLGEGSRLRREGGLERIRLMERGGEKRGMEGRLVET